ATGPRAPLSQERTPEPGGARDRRDFEQSGRRPSRTAAPSGGAAVPFRDAASEKTARSTVGTICTDCQGALAAVQGAAMTVSNLPRITKDGKASQAEQVIGFYRDAIAAGRLHAGYRLPPIRAVADLAGVTRGAVQAA